MRQKTTHKKCRREYSRAVMGTRGDHDPINIYVMMSQEGKHRTPTRDRDTSTPAPGPVSCRRAASRAGPSRRCARRQSRGSCGRRYPLDASPRPPGRTSPRGLPCLRGRRRDGADHAAHVAQHRRQRRRSPTARERATCAGPPRPCWPRVGGRRTWCMSDASGGR